MTVDPVKLGKYLSLVLRHDPAAAGVMLDAQGWAKIDEIVIGAGARGHSFTRADVLHVVATNSKRRYAVSEDGQNIRAVQGHSVEVALPLVAVEPPEVLWHGTADRFITSIMREGLTRQSRQHVHLSTDEQTAHTVGSRHGRVVILRIDAGRMHRDGLQFYQAENGVWLTHAVAVEYLAVNAK